jgi:hypothetical protein
MLVITEGKIYGQVGVSPLLDHCDAERRAFLSANTHADPLEARAPLCGLPYAALGQAPAYTSMRGILQRLDPAELEQAFRRHAEEFIELAPIRH